jgi:integrase
MPALARPWQTVLRLYRQHDARHTANSLLHELGVDSQPRMARLGHATEAVNWGYLHIRVPVVASAAKTLGEALTRE